ncbi:MAG: FKBP-type peptidyl-prolyl cis-trans isomerase [Pseudomonadota bacterium]
MIRLLLAAALLVAPATTLAKSSPKPPVGKVRLPVLSYTINASGPASGATAQRKDMVTVDYTLTLLDGTVVDSSVARGEPATFPLNQLIPAWQVLVQLMRPGDDWTFYVPPQYGYGSTARDQLPANSFLIFRVKLIAARAAE